MSDPLEIARQLRADLDAIDAAAVRRAVTIYGAARRRLIAQIEALLEALGDPAAPFTGNMLSLASRAELLRQIETLLTRAGVQIEPTLRAAREQAISAAMQAAEEMAAAQGWNVQQRAALAREWARLDERAVRELVNTLADGTPLARWLRNLGPETRTAVEEAIERAVVEHVNVGDLARILTNETGMAERRAMMAVRESSFGVQRRANDQIYKANEHLLSGKMRVERNDGKTCRFCLAENGKIYPINATMPGHVGCRRIEVAVLKSGRGLQKIESGEEWLRKQSVDVQTQAFGGNREARDAWHDGDVELSDFTETVDTEWGPQGRVRGLSYAREKAARQQRNQRAAD